MHELHLDFGDNFVAPRSNANSHLAVDGRRQATIAPFFGSSSAESKLIKFGVACHPLIERAPD